MSQSQNEESDIFTDGLAAVLDLREEMTGLLLKAYAKGVSRGIELASLARERSERDDLSDQARALGTDPGSADVAGVPGV